MHGVTQFQTSMPKVRKRRRIDRWKVRDLDNYLCTCRHCDVRGDYIRCCAVQDSKQVSRHIRCVSLTMSIWKWTCCKQKLCPLLQVLKHHPCQHSMRLNSEPCTSCWCLLSGVAAQIILQTRTYVLAWIQIVGMNAKITRCHNASNVGVLRPKGPDHACLWITRNLKHKTTCFKHTKKVNMNCWIPSWFFVHMYRNLSDLMHAHLIYKVTYVLPDLKN